MVKTRMPKPFVGLLTLMVVCALAGCSGTEPDDAAGPDVVDLVETIQDVEAEAIDIVVPPLPKLSITVKEVKDPPCACPEAGWCAVTRKDFEIYVNVALLNKPEGGFKGVTKVSLLHTGSDGEANVVDDAQSTVKGDDNEDYYPLYFQIDAIDTGTEYTDGVHKLSVRVETDVVYSVGDFELVLEASKFITVVVDTTAPVVLGDPEKPFSAPVAGEVYAQFLPVSYCLDDLHPQAGQGKGAGLDLESIKFSLVNLDGALPVEAPEGASKKCPVAVPLQFDVAQNNTDTYDFQLEVADCIGNVGTALVPDITVVGLPDYEVPSRACFDEEVATGLGEVVQTRPVHLGTVLHGQTYAPDEYPDLALFGSAGVAFAMNDGKGKIGPPGVVVPEMAVTDGYAWDVNDDTATDLVVLLSTEAGSELHVYLQDVHVDKDLSWVPTGLFPAEPTETYVLSAKVYSTMDRYDVNGDGFDDLVVVGADDVDSGALLLHSGEVAPYPEDKEYPEPDPEDPKTMAPDQPDHFVLHDKFQGVGGISDLYVGQFRFSAGGTPGPPEIAVVRPSLGLLTVITLDQEFKFGAGLDTLYCWGAATRIAKPAELRRGTNVLETDNSDLWDDPNSPGLEDLVVYSDTTKSFHFVPNKGGQSSSGYFALHGESHPGLLCFLGDNPDMWDAGEVGFGQASVAGAVSFLYVQPPEQAECGYVVHVGEEPDKIWLGDVARSGDDVGDGVKDGILDIIVPVSASNHVAFHPGNEDASYCAGMRVNPGQDPRACTLADFDLDGVLDVICVTTRSDLTEGLAQCFSQFGPDTAEGMSESLPIDLALPLSVDWRSGPVTATQILVADVEEDGDNDIIVATAPELQYYKYPEIGDQWSSDWATEEDVGGGMDSESVPLILTYRLESGLQESIMPDQSAVDLSFTQELSSVTAGDFDANGEPDLAVAIDTNATTVCDGRTVDLLIGSRKVTGLINPEEVGTDDELMSLYNETGEKGHFAPEGGFLLSQNVTGVMAARLNADNVDDLIVFFKEYGTVGEVDYQPHGVATYLTVHDAKWNECAGNTKKPYFPMAPPYAPQAIPLPNPCDAVLPAVPEEPVEGEIVLEYSCLPSFEPSFQYTAAKGYLHPGQAQPSDETQQWTAGDTPVAGTTGDFYSAEGTGQDGCVDFFVANSGSHNATFIRGDCTQGGYKFITPVHLFPIGSDPLDIKTADLNHDEYIDTVAALGNQISLTYGVQGELFDSPLYLDKGKGFDDVAPIALAVEDVNDDGWVDLLVISKNHDSVLVYLNGGVSKDEQLDSPPHRTRFLGPFLLSVGANPTAILVAPLYTDLAPDPSGNCNDVAVLNSGSGTITLLRNRRCKK